MQGHSHLEVIGHVLPGASVLVAEKDAQYGGTTAWSGGWMWIPRNPLAVEAVGAASMNLNPNDIDMLRWAKAKGYGCPDLLRSFQGPFECYNIHG